MVADEVRKLAEQSSQSSSFIQELLKEIMIKKERVVDSLQKTDQIVDANVLSIGSSVTSYDEFMDLQQGMNQQLQDIAGHIGQLSAEGGLISNSMIELKQKHQYNDGNITEIATAIEQVSATFQEISAHVEHVSQKSEHLYALQNK